MKKRIKSISLIILIIIIICTTLKIIKKEHRITYNVSNYTIKESFHKEKTEYWYDFIIENKKNNFSYSLNEKLNKKKHVIKEIKVYKKKDLTCILPIYRKKVKQNELYCNLSNKSISTNYLIQSNNKEFKEILNKVKKYQIKTVIPKSKKKTFEKLTVYQKGIDQNYKYIVWNYKGIYILDNEKLLYQEILNYDLYDNVMSTIVDRYYVLFENSSVDGIKNIYYYDLEKNKLRSFELTEPLSKDSYINGVIDNLIYVTDKKAKKQYTINIKKRKIEEIGTEEKKYQKYQNHQLSYLSKSDFFMNNQYFDNEKLTDKTLTSLDLRKEHNYFYYLEENKLYKVMDNNKKSPILLFELSNVKEWKVIDRDILLIADDCLYFYSENSGLVKIVESNELKYNYKNICNVWKK